MTLLEKIQSCLDAKKHFVLQGGAGSGKTETLKNLLSHIAKSAPSKKVACITLTNKAVDEIDKRIDGIFPVSTIHSFLFSLVKNYQINLHKIIHKIFEIPFMQEQNHEHKDFKKLYEKFATKNYFFDKVKHPKCIGKKDYDKAASSYNSELNARILVLNSAIRAKIDATDPHSISYNQTKFDNLKTLSFGHDSLIILSTILIAKFPTLRKIVCDKFDYIFVDEYQDTSPLIVKTLLEVIAPKNNIVIGFFGDSMQGIYEDGIGHVEKYIEDGVLTKINKEDNFRCSKPIVDFLNSLRLDDLRQEVAYKQRPDGRFETAADRRGSVSCFYAIYPGKPNVRSSYDEKNNYLKSLRRLVSKAHTYAGSKTLMLTNKSIAGELGFGELYDVFTDRYGPEVNDQIEKVLSIIQLKNLYVLCNLFDEKKYNEVLQFLKRENCLLKGAEDKKRLIEILNSISDSKKSMYQTLEDAIAAGLICKSEAHHGFVEHKNRFIADLNLDPAYVQFCENYRSGKNTLTRMVAGGSEIDQYEFDDLERKMRKDKFYNDLFSDVLPFSQLVSYFNYVDEKTNYITMHKTKGTGIENVVLVLDEYFWEKYDFKNIFSKIDPQIKNQEATQKLMYVGCSRAIENLICVKLIEQGEEKLITERFTNATKVDLSELI